MRDGLYGHGVQAHLAEEYPAQVDALLTLRDWSDTPALEMQLIHYDGREFDVIFRLHESAMSNVEPVRYTTPERDGEPYRATINLMTI